MTTITLTVPQWMVYLIILCVIWMALKCVYGFFGHLEDRLDRKDKMNKSKLVRGFKLMEDLYDSEGYLSAEEHKELEEIKELIE